MKDFICVSCWTSFQVDASTLETQSNVTCPRCKAVQPTSTAAVASSMMSADDTMVDGGLDDQDILGMLGDPTFGASPPKSSDAALAAPAAPSSTGGNAGLDDIWPPPPGSQNDGSHGWAMPPEEVEPVASSKVGTLDRALKELESVEPAVGSVVIPEVANQVEALGLPPDPVAPPAGAGADLGWRIKLASGLVLSFPTIDMVTAWAKDKSPDSVQLSYGTEDFVSYGGFRDRFEQLGDPVAAFFARGKVTPPPGTAAEDPQNAGVGLDEPGVEDFEVFDPDEEFVPDPAAVAAAAARDRPNTENMYDRRFQFRTAPEPSGPSRGVIGALAAITIALVVAAVLVWQGVL